jgi:hypothetical protein
MIQHSDRGCPGRRRRQGDDVSEYDSIVPVYQDGEEPPIPLFSLYGDEAVPQVAGRQARPLHPVLGTSGLFPSTDVYGTVDAAMRT